MAGSWPGPQGAHQGINVSPKKEIGRRGGEQKGQECLHPSDTQKGSGRRKKGRKQRQVSGHHGRSGTRGKGGSGSWPSGDSQIRALQAQGESRAVTCGARGPQSPGLRRGRGSLFPSADQQTFTRCPVCSWAPGLGPGTNLCLWTDRWWQSRG